MQNFKMHAGAEVIKYEDLDLIPMPQQTDTYQPVSHFHLAKLIKTISQDLLHGYALRSENYGVAREGQRFFGALSFKNGDTETGLSIGVRNSYDKSMTIGIVAGMSIFVCDNLAFSGDITILRKHSKNVWDEMENQIVSTCYKAAHQYKNIANDVTQLKCIEMTNDQGFAELGKMFGHGLVGPRQAVALKNEWLKPRHEVWQARNAWSLYNCATQVLKDSPVNEIMERHVDLHSHFRNLIEPVVDRFDEQLRPEPCDATAFALPFNV